MRLVFCILLFTWSSNLLAQNAHKLRMQADGEYAASQYENAELNYRKAKEKESDLKSNFNLGNTVFQQERYEEAVEHYLSALNKTDDPVLKSKIHYNAGNAHFNNQNLQEAINAYKEALKADPDNANAQYNLALSKQILRQQQQEQQQQQNQDNQNQEQNQEDQEQEQEQNDQQEQQNQNSENQEDQQQQQESEEQKDQEEQEQKQQTSQFDSTRLEKQKLDSTDALKLLQIIQGEEQKVREKMRKFNSNRVKPDKDW